MTQTKSNSTKDTKSKRPNQTLAEALQEAFAEAGLQVTDLTGSGDVMKHVQDNAVKVADDWKEYWTTIFGEDYIQPIMETEYLFSSEANKKLLLDSIAQLERDDLVDIVDGNMHRHEEYYQQMLERLLGDEQVQALSLEELIKQNEKTLRESITNIGKTTGVHKETTTSTDKPIPSATTKSTLAAYSYDKTTPVPLPPSIVTEEQAVQFMEKQGYQHFEVYRKLGMYKMETKTEMVRQKT